MGIEYAPKARSPNGFTVSWNIRNWRVEHFKLSYALLRYASLSYDMLR